MKRWISIVLLLLAAACTDESAAGEALRSQGLTNVEFKGWAPMSCGQDDFSSTGFDATNPQGNRVSGVVCCGMLFKSCTVRW